MNLSGKSKWIWLDQDAFKDSYGEFYTEFDYNGGNVNMAISVDSNYTLFLNGEYVESGQYSDFPHYKVYDELDITSHCKPGKNKMGIIVWYYGTQNMSYYTGNAALRFEVENDGKVISASGEYVLSRLSRAYASGREKVISGQIGFSFLYDSTKEDGWLSGDLEGFEKSRIVDQDLPLYPRVTKKLLVKERVPSTFLRVKENAHLFDLGREEVGYLTLKVKSPQKQKLRIAYGEHIVDGKVRDLIGPRDFSVEVVVGEGVTEYTNFFRRLGLRYLEVYAEGEIEFEYISVRPTEYPLKFVERKFKSELHQKMYDISMRTLHLCMHEHYEDCPWREQAFYTMDSRNQMLCGYYAFEEFEFPRQNLFLMSKDHREDGFLSMCMPIEDGYWVIPSFGLHYFFQVYEYTVYSKDMTLIKEIFPKLKALMQTFLDEMQNGLVPSRSPIEYWNFYEWTEGMDGNIGEETPFQFEAAINCLLSMALTTFQKICDLLGEEGNYGEIAKELSKKVRETFFDEKQGVFINVVGKPDKSELTNAWAVLCGAASEEEAKRICEIFISENDLVKISLSMACFKYDVLLKVGGEKYKDYILQHMEERYQKMLDAGATTFWETDLGDADFFDAGSLCHGWAAMPIYYFNLFDIE